MKVRAIGPSRLVLGNGIGNQESLIFDSVYTISKVF